MKTLIFSDIHWSKTSSLIQSQGEMYTTRLEHLIDTMNWINKKAIELKCENMICAGDFFDKAVINDEELTALTEINWANIPCYFLCGNHESSVIDLRYSALTALDYADRYIISEQCWSFKDNKTQIHFVPYVTESERGPLEDYLDKDPDCTRHIVISHNDISGVNYGGFVSKDGFSIEEIENNCDLYLNGHLHNSSWITKKILNVGSSSGHNFTNDSFNYSYGIWILDTDTLEIEFIENPYGFNFYKFDVTCKNNLKIFEKLKNNSVISVRSTESFKEELNNILEQYKDKIIEKRLTYFRDDELSDEEVADKLKDLNGSDYLLQFKNFVLDRCGSDEVVISELQNILK